MFKIALVSFALNLSNIAFLHFTFLTHQVSPKKNSNKNFTKLAIISSYRLPYVAKKSSLFFNRATCVGPCLWTFPKISHKTVKTEKKQNAKHSLTPIIGKSLKQNVFAPLFFWFIWRQIFAKNNNSVTSIAVWCIRWKKFKLSKKELLLCAWRNFFPWGILFIHVLLSSYCRTDQNDGSFGRWLRQRRVPRRWKFKGELRELFLRV